MADFSYVPLRSSEILARETSRLLLVDLQEKLLPHILKGEMITRNCEKLIRGAELLSVPITVTEQYPQGLGKTVDDLRRLLPEETTVREKLRFSAAEAVDWKTAGESDNDRFQIVVAGIESHICVQQTVLDLMSAGYRVYVVADAVGSQQKTDWQISLSRMADSGATVTTSESVLFEWCEVAGTAKFKEIRKIVLES